jgi:HD superfamily phosphohydrolase
MESAIHIIRSKGHEITDEEAEAVTAAILLHDIGHGPFSHSLEATIIEGINHEELSLLFMERLNEETGGKLELAIKIFLDEHPKKFLHQLVSSQLDMDRLDYLKRDSFFSGVTEGVIGSDRIIKMLNVKDDQLVIDVKGIYSIEKFLVARRLMYWQVYFHKTAISAENILLMILKRAKFLAMRGEKLFATPALQFFLEQNINREDFLKHEKKEILTMFSKLDDNDIVSAIKVWTDYPDKVLSTLCYNLNNRRLFKTVVRKEKFNTTNIENIRKSIEALYGFSAAEAEYFVASGEISNFAYSSLDDRIKIMLKDNTILDITEASDMLNVSVLSRTVRKYFLCYPKEIETGFE